MPQSWSKYRCTPRGDRSWVLCVWVAAVAFAGIGIGCSNQSESLIPFEPMNADIGLGEGVEIDTLMPTKAEARRERQAYTGPSPSVVGVARSNWQATTIGVPISGVNHHPHYTDDKPRFAKETARARGEYPTQATVLETGTSESVGSLALEGVAAPARAAWDIIRFPVRVWRPGQRPWSETQSPMRSESYARRAVIASQYPGRQSSLRPTVTGTPVPGGAKGTETVPVQSSPPPPNRPGSPARFKE